MSEAEGMGLILSCFNMVGATIGFALMISFLSNYMARVVGKSTRKINDNDSE